MVHSPSCSLQILSHSFGFFLKLQDNVEQKAWFEARWYKCMCVHELYVCVCIRSKVQVGGDTLLVVCFQVCLLPS